MQNLPNHLSRRFASIFSSAHFIALAFFISGAAGLVLEVIWTRLLHLAFGANAPAVATVLAVYMGGMALGAFVVSRWPWLRHRPLQRYAVLELLIAVVALLLPWLIDAVAPLHHWLVQSLVGEDNLLLLMIVRALIVGALLLLPTAAMGATLPLLGQAVRKLGHKNVAERVGRLYAINLLGAVCGAGLVGFVLVPFLGMRLSNFTAAGLDLLAAGLAGLVALRQGALSESNTEPATRSDKTQDAAQKREFWLARRALLLALFGLGLSGLLAMQLQVLWSRALSVVIGSSTYAFSLILVVTLAGMSAGGHWSTIRGRQEGPRQALRRMAGLFALAALGIVLGTWMVDKLPLLIRDAARMPHLSVASLFAVEMLAIGLVVFIPAFALGGILPMTLQVGRRLLRQQAGRFVGKAYAINTLGAIFGSLVGGFFLLPYLGVNLALRVTGLVYLGLALLVWLAAHPRRQGVKALWPMTLFSVALASLALMGTSFDVMRWSAGYFRVYLPRGDRDDRPSDDRLLFHRDGIIATVTVEDNHGSTALKVNGKVDASSQGDMPTQILSGLLPLAFHDQAPRSLVIGFGSGVTVGAMLRAGLPALDLIELEPEVLRAGRLFSHVNFRPWRDPRVHLIVDDGRNFLLRKGEPYQLIVSEPSNPWMSGAASLFTEEFWQLASSRLDQDGIFLQWVQLYELGPERIRSLVGTFTHVFPHALMFSSHPGSSDTFLLGARQPLKLDMNLARKLFAQEQTHEMLERAGVHAPAELLALQLLDDEGLRKYVQGAALNTDDNAYVEFRAPLDLIDYAINDADLSELETALGHRSEIIPRSMRGELEPGADHCKQLVILAQAMLQQGALRDARAYQEQLGQECTQQAQIDLQQRRFKKMIDLLTEPAQEPVVDAQFLKTGDPRYARVVMSMIEGHDSTALDDLEAVLDVEEKEPSWLFLWAYLCIANSRNNDAAVLLDRVLADQNFVQRMPQVYYYAARTALELNMGARAAELARYYVEAKAVKYGRD